jgi:hypothetical protein
MTEIKEKRKNQDKISVVMGRKTKRTEKYMLTKQTGDSV